MQPTKNPAEWKHLEILEGQPLDGEHLVFIYSLFKRLQQNDASSAYVLGKILPWKDPFH